VILSNDGVLHNPLATAEGQPTGCMSGAPMLRDNERALIMQTLESAGWVISGANGAAARLGLKRTTLISKMKRLGVCKMVRFGIA
jgi:formate hydrogenlyase transcriptional activator